jgi:ribonuclease HI
VESLRNYVANHEVTIKESKLNNTEYYYNNLELSTTTEKIFWKWCKKLNLISL